MQDLTPKPSFSFAFSFFADGVRCVDARPDPFLLDPFLLVPNGVLPACSVLMS